MDSEKTSDIEELRQRISDLEEENGLLKSELELIQRSPYVKQGITHLHYYAKLDREEILHKEVKARVNERQGTLFELKNQIRRYAPLVGIDPENIRISVTEALQNIIEHGYGKYAEVELEVNNSAMNPYFKMSFKHEQKPGMKYTLSEINENVKKGDVTSEAFDFESARGRGEYLMKQLADERRVINGVEITPDGKKIHYFKRVLINYRDPKGPRAETSFDDIRAELDRLEPEEALCYFHLDHKRSVLSSVTIVIHQHREQQVRRMMEEAGFEMSHKDSYYTTVFCSFVPLRDHSNRELEKLFEKVKKKVTAEKD